MSQQSQQHKRNVRIISIDGNIGSGKSTLVADLKERLGYDKNKNINICFLQEPIDLWNTIRDENDVTILENYYKDQVKYAFTFQMMAYISRLSMLKREINKNKYDIIITERSTNTDRYVFAKMLYDEKKIEKIQYEIYLKWFDEFISEIPQIEVIYIRTFPHVAHERVKKRAREGESVIELEYLKRCHEYHENWLMKKERGLSLVFDGNVNIYDEPKVLENWIDTIKTYLYNTVIEEYNDYA
jgi:deoxyadenosine/deoxycytidine kinase